MDYDMIRIHIFKNGCDFMKKIIVPNQKKETIKVIH